MKKLRINFSSRVTLWFTGLCLFATVLGYISGGAADVFFSVYRTSWLDPLQYVRLFTHVLGHADFEHFFNNAMFILILAPMIEEKYTSKNLAFMIATTAVVTGLLNVILMPHTAVLGASGIVFMLIVLSSFSYFDGHSIPATFILVLVLFIGREVWNAVSVADSVSQFAHIMGGLCGAFFGFTGGGRRALSGR